VTFDKELLFKPQLPEEDVDVPGRGTFRVRALTRAEVLSLRHVKEGPDQAAAVERKMMSLAVIAFNGEPGSLTEADIGRWQKASAAGEMEPITRRVAVLSGMADDAAKAAYKEFEADPDSEFRVLPSGQVGDDGGPAPGGDV
jgi:hypothetical protein